MLPTVLALDYVADTEIILNQSIERELCDAKLFLILTNSRNMREIFFFIGTISFLISRFQEATSTSWKFLRPFLSSFLFLLLFRAEQMSAPDFISGNSGHHLINLFLRGLKLHFPDGA